jgi:hypothetical protein
MGLLHDRVQALGAVAPTLRGTFEMTAFRPKTVIATQKATSGGNNSYPRLP